MVKSVWVSFQSPRGSLYSAHVFSFRVRVIHRHTYEQNIHAHKMSIYKDIFYHLNMCVCAYVCESVTCELSTETRRWYQGPGVRVTGVMTCPMWVLNKQQPLEPTFQPSF